MDNNRSSTNRMSGLLILLAVVLALGLVIVWIANARTEKALRNELVTARQALTTAQKTEPAPTTAAPAPTQTPAPTATTAITAPQPTAAPTQKPAAPVVSCTKHGQQAWNDSTNMTGYGRSPIGGLNENCNIVAEIWGASGGYVIVVPPYTVAWVANHYGGTGWFVTGSAEAVLNVAKGNVDNITKRDGKQPKLIDLSKGTFDLLVELQTKPK